MREAISFFNCLKDVIKLTGNYFETCKETLFLKLKIYFIHEQVNINNAGEREEEKKNTKKAYVNCIINNL